MTCQGLTDLEQDRNKQFNVQTKEENHENTDNMYLHK